jgi:predicted alpha-1,6-mannanase (GH76 family)
MYFRGTDDKVWKVNPLNPNDNSNPGGFKTKSNVFVANDGYMYFRGTDDKVWKVNPLDPNDNSNPGGFKTQSDVIVAGNIMYFQGTDHLVWQYDFNDGPPQAYAHAAAEALQHWYNWKGNILGLDGRWNSTGWWNSANALNSLIDYMKITNSHSYLNAVANTFDKCKGNNFLNEYYDDEGWWALTWINAYDLTKDIHYLDMAKTIFQDMTGGWDNFFYGGIYWQKNKTDGNGNAPYKNAIANELFLTIAVRLYQRTSTSTYLDWASQEWNWFKQSGMINSKSLVNDGLDPATGWNNGVTTWTYNQGVILGGLVDLTMATQDPSYICVAQEIANAAIKTLVNANGILIELATGDPGDDRPQFKGIFIRNLAYLFGFCGQPNYSSFIQKNAQSLLQNNRDFANKFGYNWFGPVDTTDPARQTSALDALNAAMLTSGG